MQSIESVQGPTIAVGSTNPVKLNAARNVVTRVWAGAEVQAVDVPSGVAAQPLRDQDAITGAQSGAGGPGRAGRGLRRGHRGQRGRLAAGHVRHRLGRGGGSPRRSRHRCGRALPPAGTPGRPRRSGAELGALMDEIVNEDNTKQRQGAVGIFTGGLVDRTQALELAVIFALTRFVAPIVHALSAVPISHPCPASPG
ncbi:MAG: DUF84 family protein [Caldilineaceae bacterium]